MNTGLIEVYISDEEWLGLIIADLRHQEETGKLAGEKISFALRRWYNSRLTPESTIVRDRGDGTGKHVWRLTVITTEEWGVIQERRKKRSRNSGTTSTEPREPVDDPPAA